MIRMPWKTFVRFRFAFAGSSSPALGLDSRVHDGVKVFRVQSNRVLIAPPVRPDRGG